MQLKMGLLTRLNIRNQLKKVNAILTTATSDLVKKADCKTKISEVEKKILDHDHDKYIATQEVNNLMTDSFAARLKQLKLILPILQKRQILMIN